MDTRSRFNELFQKVLDKHGSLSDAIRAAGIDPYDNEGLKIRRTIERRKEQNVNWWDVFALMGLLSFRKRRKS